MILIEITQAQKKASCTLPHHPTQQNSCPNYTPTPLLPCSWYFTNVRIILKHAQARRSILLHNPHALNFRGI